MYSKPSSKHTPGPWIALEDDEGINGPVPHTIRDEGGAVIAELVGSDTEGNARLIAAAPALFTVLHRIVIDMNSYCDDASYDPTFNILEAEAVLRSISGKDEELIASLWDRQDIGADL